MCLLGGALCLLAGVLCLVSVSWSASITISIYNDPLVVAAMKREVGSSIYIGWAASVMLLLGGALICLVCMDKVEPRPSEYSYTPYSRYGPFSDHSSHMSTLRSDAMRSIDVRKFDPPLRRESEPQPPIYNDPRMSPVRYEEPPWVQPADYGL